MKALSGNIDCLKMLFSLMKPFNFPLTIQFVIRDSACNERCFCFAEKFNY